MSHAGMGVLLAHPAGSAAIERLEAEDPGPAIVPIAPVLRKDGTSIWYSLSHYLRKSTARAFSETFERLWLGGALITLGDALAAQGYFDRGPDLELVRHLRNGVAHGNRFHLLNEEPRRLARFTGLEQRLMSDGVTSTPPGDAITFESRPGSTANRCCLTSWPPATSATCFNSSASGSSGWVTATRQWSSSYSGDAIFSVGYVLRRSSVGRDTGRSGVRRPVALRHRDSPLLATPARFVGSGLAQRTRVRPPGTGPVEARRGADACMSDLVPVSSQRRCSAAAGRKREGHVPAACGTPRALTRMRS